MGEFFFKPTPSIDGVRKPKLAIEAVTLSEGYQQLSADPRVQRYFQLIQEVVLRHTNNGGMAIPFLLPATTDLRHFIRHPTHVPVCIGFLPALFPDDIAFIKLYHGVNERIPIRTLNWGVRVLYDTILKICT